MYIKEHSSVLLIVVVLFLSFIAASKDISDIRQMSHQRGQQDTCNKITNLDLSICYGDTVQVGGEEFFNSGQYTVTLTAANGCDSIILLNLMVNPNQYLIISDSICQGQSYNFSGSLLSSAGVYLAELTSSSGCDSIIQLILNVTPVIVITIDSTICEGKLIDEGGQVITEGGTYSIIYSSSMGCDSLVILNLIIEKLEVSVSIFENSLIVLDTAATYQWIDCDTDENIPGANGQLFIPTQSGNYSVSIILEDSCIGTSDCIEFIVTGTAENSISNAVSVYPNPTDGMIYITNETVYPVTSAIVSTIFGQQIEKFILSDKSTLDLSSLEKGVYLIKLEINHTQVTKKVIIK